jgi:hypothetical protein
MSARLQFWQAAHAAQVESKKSVLAAAGQVDDMYDMLAAYEQKARRLPVCMSNMPVLG